MSKLQEPGAIKFRYTNNDKYLTFEERQFYEENGYLLFKKVVDDHILEECRKRFLDICNTGSTIADSLVMKDYSLRRKNVKGELYEHRYPPNVKNKAFHGVFGLGHLPRVNLVMDKGDTVFFHPLLLHGSGPNVTKGFRKTISCHYADTNCTFNKVDENVAKEVMEVHRRKGRVVSSYEDVWKYKSRLVRGPPGNFQQLHSRL